MDDSFLHTSSRERRVIRRRFSQNYIQIPWTACVNPKHIILLICAGHSERWIARTAVDNGDIPWHFTARRTKFHCKQSPKCKWMNRVRICSYWARKSQQRRAMWPLREGREIWGVDGAFTSMSNVCVFFFIKRRQIRSNKFRIESARVRGSNKDGRDVF